MKANNGWNGNLKNKCLPSSVKKIDLQVLQQELKSLILNKIESKLKRSEPLAASITTK
jgi:hypothetical protein